MARRAAAVFAGMACAATLSGAYGALTTIPAWCSYCVVAITLAALRDGKTLLCFVGGVAAGCTLPRLAPQPAGDVVTRAPASSGPGDLFRLLERIDRDPAALVGSRAIVTGAWTPATASYPATVSRRIMSCCAADAVSVGFDVAPAKRIHVAAGTWVRVAGVVRSRIAGGELRYGLEAATVCRLTSAAPKPRSARLRRGREPRLSATLRG